MLIYINFADRVCNNVTQRKKASKCVHENQPLKTNLIFLMT